jgi:uncharacterized protein GlcG (DUF336 family)
MIHPKTGAVRVASEVAVEAKAAAKARVVETTVAVVKTGAKGTTKEKDPEAVPLTKQAFIVLL